MIKVLIIEMSRLCYVLLISLLEGNILKTLIHYAMFHFIPTFPAE